MLIICNVLSGVLSCLCVYFFLEQFSGYYLAWGRFVNIALFHSYRQYTIGPGILLFEVVL